MIDRLTHHRVLPAAHIAELAAILLGAVALATTAMGLRSESGFTTGVQSTNPTNDDLLQSVATGGAAGWVGTGPVSGTRKHAYAEGLLDRYQQIYGYRGLDTEVS